MCWKIEEIKNWRQINTNKFRNWYKLKEKKIEWLDRYLNIGDQKIFLQVNKHNKFTGNKKKLKN